MAGRSISLPTAPSLPFGRSSKTTSRSCTLRIIATIMVGSFSAWKTPGLKTAWWCVLSTSLNAIRRSRNWQICRPAGMRGGARRGSHGHESGIQTIPRDHEPERASGPLDRPLQPNSPAALVALTLTDSKLPASHLPDHLARLSGSGLPSSWNKAGDLGPRDGAARYARMVCSSSWLSGEAKSQPMVHRPFSSWVA